MYFWCSKEPCHRDGSFEYPQHMFWLRNKKNIFSFALLSGGLVNRCFKDTYLCVVLFCHHFFVFLFLYCIVLFCHHYFCILHYVAIFKLKYKMFHVLFCKPESATYKFQRSVLARLYGNDTCPGFKIFVVAQWWIAQLEI